MITTSNTLPNFQRGPKTSIQNLIINQEKVFQIFQSLDPKKTYGCDEVSIVMMKMWQVNVGAFVHDYEKCLESGVYPVLWKRSNVTPVHEKGSKQGSLY